MNLDTEVNGLGLNSREELRLSAIWVRASFLNFMNAMSMQTEEQQQGGA